MGGTLFFGRLLTKRNLALLVGTNYSLFETEINTGGVLVCRNNLDLLFFSFFLSIIFCRSATGSMINVIFHSLSPQEYDRSHRNPSSSSFSVPRKNSFFSSPGKSGCVNLPGGGGISAPIFPPPPTFARWTKYSPSSLPNTQVLCSWTSQDVRTEVHSHRHTHSLSRLRHCMRASFSGVRAPGEVEIHDQDEGAAEGHKSPGRKSGVYLLKSCNKSTILLMCALESRVREAHHCRLRLFSHEK